MILLALLWSALLAWFLWQCLTAPEGEETAAGFRFTSGPGPSAAEIFGSVLFLLLLAACGWLMLGA